MEMQLKFPSLLTFSSHLERNIAQALFMEIITHTLKAGITSFFGFFSPGIIAAEFKTIYQRHLCILSWSFNVAASDGYGFSSPDTTAGI